MINLTSLKLKWKRVCYKVENCKIATKETIFGTIMK